MKKINEKILIVDDIQKNIQMLGNVLSQKDYDLAYATTGREALRICETEDFDLILLDIMMPEVDGYEVCERLKSNPKTAEVPIIFLTAKADMESIVKGFSMGGQEYITKPFNSSELMARVETHLLLRRQKNELKEMNRSLEEKVMQRTKELQLANEKLQRLDIAKSNFLSLISHEMRTPLNGIVGLTELLKNTSIEEDQQTYLNYLTEESTRMINFIEVATLITRLRTNQYKADILPVSFNHILETSISQFKKENPDSVFHLTNDAQGRQILVLADTDLLTFGLIALIENATQYGGPEVSIDIHVVEDQEKVKIDFMDNGPGFSNEAMEHLFQLFSAGDIMHHEGKGLSLATLKLIIDLHQGSLDVHNKDDNGAVITIQLERAEY